MAHSPRGPGSAPYHADGASLMLMPRSVPSPSQADSRMATNELLAELRAGRWRSRAWGRFLYRATRRSVQQALLHPRPLAEATLLHGAFLVVAHRRRWTMICWTLTVTHLGMLEGRDTLGMANLLTLARANLPAVGTGSGRWLGPAAAAADLFDGKLARAIGTETRFGAYADPLADAVFWTDFALRYETNSLLRYMPIIAWGAPTLGITITSAWRGRMLDHQRPTLLRLGAALEILLALRAVARTLPDHPRADTGRAAGPAG